MSENNEMAPSFEPIVEPVVIEQPDIIEEAPKIEVKPEPVVIKETKPEPVKVHTPKPSNTVFLYSLKDLNINGFGSLKKGYNKVSSADAEKWLTKNAVRLATEAEIKTYLK